MTDKEPSEFAKFNIWYDSMVERSKIELDDDDLDYKSVALMDVGYEVGRKLNIIFQQSIGFNIQFNQRHQIVLKELKVESNIAWNNKKEVDSQLWADVEYCRLYRKMMNCKVLIDSLENLIENIKANRFLITNIIKLREMRNLGMA